MSMCTEASEISDFRWPLGPPLPKWKNVMWESRRGCCSDHSTCSSPFFSTDTCRYPTWILSRRLQLKDFQEPEKWVYIKRDTSGHTACTPSAHIQLPQPLWFLLGSQRVCLPIELCHKTLPFSRASIKEGTSTLVHEPDFFPQNPHHAIVSLFMVSIILLIKSLLPSDTPQCLSWTHIWDLPPNAPRIRIYGRLKR